MPKLGERGEEKLQKNLLHVSHRRRPTTSECVCYQHEAQERTAKPCRARFTGIEESFFFDILFDSIVFRSLSRSPTTHSRRNSFFFCGDMERKKKLNYKMLTSHFHASQFDISLRSDSKVSREARQSWIRNFFSIFFLFVIRLISSERE